MIVRSAILFSSLALFTGAPGSPLFAQPQEPMSRTGISGGMGVSYFNATGIVDRVNGTGITAERSGTFVAAAEFFGAVSFPVSPDWSVKVEYAYLIAGYNVATLFPGSEFTVTAHLPTVVVHYIFVDKGVYNVKGGAGLGYHFGAYRERYGTADAEFTGSGVGAKFDFEANTAFGDNFYAYIGGDVRFDFIGTLTAGTGTNVGIGAAPSLNFFSIGAKLGFTYYI